MTVCKFLLNGLVCVGKWFIVSLKMITQRLSGKQLQICKKQEIKLTAMIYTKQADLKEHIEIVAPQCKCDTRG